MKQACTSDNIQASELMVVNANNVDLMVGLADDFHVRSCQMPTNGNGMVYAMYGDLAYVQSIYLLSGFWKPPTGSNKALFNRQMSSV